MKRHILIYGLLGGVLIAVLKLSEYRFLVIEHSFEIYAGLVAAIFAALGIWLGIRLTRPQPAVVIQQVAAEPSAILAAAPAPAFTLNESKREDLGITPRELEILVLMAEGLSNREIATRLFVSENTVKTHSSRVFDKLGARRRTQAVQFGKQFGLLP